MGPGVFRLGIFEVEQLFGDGHPQLVNLAEVREAGVLAVEDLVPVQVDFQAAAVRRRELDGDVAGGVGLEELVRQPRGDGEVPSRYAVDDFRFNFSVQCSCHAIPLLIYMDAQD